MEISISYTIPDGFLYKSKSLRQQTTKELVTSMKATKNPFLFSCTYSYSYFALIYLLLSLYLLFVSHELQLNQRHIAGSIVARFFDV